MTENDYKLLDRYLAGELNAVEQQEVQRRIQEDPDFEEALRFRQLTERYLRTQANEPGLRKVLTTLGAAHFTTSAESTSAPELGDKGRRLWPGLLALAAALALLLLVWQPWVETDLYAQYAVHRPLALVEKGVGTDLAVRAETTFNNGAYEAAYVQLKEYVASDTSSIAAKLALGIAALETDRIGEAIVRFQTLSDTPTSYQSTARWYLALSQLKGDQVGLARLTLQTLQDDPTYGARARELSTALE